jgi:hypothetical protein
MSLVLEALGFLLTAQSVQATLTGTVTAEATGEPLAGAVVALADLDRSAATDAAGRYVIHDVPAGPQHISVGFIGYTQRALHALVPSSGRLEINLSLRVEPVHLQTIVVHHRLPMPGLDDDDDPRKFDKSSAIAAVRNHPLLSEPDVLQAVEGGSISLHPESPSGVHIRGGSTDQSAYLLDGVPIFSPYHAAGVFSALNPDAISRISVASSLPLPGHADALSGTILAESRSPGARMSTQGSLSTSQARLTLDGSVSGVLGYLLSLRSRTPGLPVGENDPSYLHGENADVLAKLTLSRPTHLKLLVYQSGNEIEAAEEANAAGSAVPRNSFEWGSRSVGGEWNYEFGATAVQVQAWSASSEASATWRGVAARERLNSNRRDLGILGNAELKHGGSRTILGARIDRSRTDYVVRSDSGSLPWGLDAHTVLTTVFGQHLRPLAPRLRITIGASLTSAVGRARLGPNARIEWTPSQTMSISGSFARVHQFTQSLRNPESVVRNIFPPDLYIGAGAAGVPVARGDQAVFTVDYRPAGGVRLTAEAYTRNVVGLLLAAPSASGPFATDALTTGSGKSRGISAEAAMSTARIGAMASYRIQHVGVSASRIGYIPAHGDTHLVQAGIIGFPTATMSLRVGATAALGRRSTLAGGDLEWEACNLLDRGCEFGGSPHYDGALLGSTRLPHYLRIDIGFRKHWHFSAGSRDVLVALFGTVTNVLNRKNVLGYMPNATIQMVPRAPLVLGLDWRF